MPITPALPTFTADTTALAEDVTTAFAAVRDTLNTYGVLTDVARTITAIQTFSATPVFSAGWSAGAACTITTGGLTVTGNSTITGTLGGVTTLTATTGAFTTLSGTPNFSGVPTFAAGLGTQATMTITTLTNTTINTQIVQLDAGASILSLRGTVAGGSKTWARWDETGAIASLGSGADATLLGAQNAIATNATSGFVHVPAMAGTPNGTPSNSTNIPLVVDTTAGKLWCYYGAAWHYTTLT